MKIKHQFRGGSLLNLLDLIWIFKWSSILKMFYFILIIKHINRKNPNFISKQTWLFCVCVLSSNFKVCNVNINIILLLLLIFITVCIIPIVDNLKPLKLKAVGVDISSARHFFSKLLFLHKNLQPPCISQT